MQCPNCSGTNLARNGHTRHGAQRYRCKDCGRTFTGGGTGRPAIYGKPLTPTEYKRRWRAKKRQQEQG